jgi:anion-transporting  ArsA/GET3 family ATPase
VLVLTIDPARRLAQALGIPERSAKPTPVPRERLEACGVTGPGTLDAWMLDPRVVFDDVVRRMATPENAEALLNSRLYKHMSELVAGMQEYTAGEALYVFVQEGRYDLVVLDTPPSRNALDFLDAPSRLGRFIEEGVVNLFVPRDGGLLRKAGRLVGGVFSKVFGEGFVEELGAFMGAFGGMFGSMRQHAEGLRRLLASGDAAFLLVTSPEAEALGEAMFFREQLLRRQLPFAGFVLNRSFATLKDLSHPVDIAHERGEAHGAVEKLSRLADLERAKAVSDEQLVGRLATMAAPGFAVAAPHLGEAVEDLPGLLRLARGMAG